VCILDATQILKGEWVRAPERTAELTCECTFVIMFNFEGSFFAPEAVDLRGSSSNLTLLLNPLTTSPKQVLKKLNRPRVIARTDSQP